MAKDFSVSVGYPARDKNFVLPLINGEEAWRTISDHIDKAQKTIYMCFWAMEGTLELIRKSSEVFNEPRLRDKYILFNALAAAKTRGVTVRILLWDAPWDSHSTVAIQWNTDVMVRLAGKTGVFELMYQKHPTSAIGSWHQKTIIIDDVAFVEGMNAKQLDWDTSEHFAFNLLRADHRLTSKERRTIADTKDYKSLFKPRHDYMALIKGAVVSDVQANFVERWNYCLSQKVDYFKHASKLETPQQSNDYSDMKTQIVRTIPQYEPQPSGEKGILEAYLNAVRNAEKYIYIENQYFRSVTLAKAAKANQKLKIIVATQPAYLSPPEPDEKVKIAGASTYWTTESFDILRKVIPNFALFYFQSSYIDTSNKRVFVPTDLHAKMMIVDDEWYTIGSCNVNERGFDTEGELNVSVQHSSAKDLRVKILSLHLKEQCPEDIDKAFKMWFDHSSINYRAWKSRSNPKSFIFPFNQEGPLLPIVPRTWF